MKDTVPTPAEEIARLRGQVIDLGEALAALTARHAESRQRAEQIEMITGGEDR